ncbi:MAG: diguanylate cyclase, partial [Nodosilinea sp.]
VRQQANQKAAHDAMTDLPNWLLFNKQLQLSLLQGLRHGKGLAVGILNLGQFKRINTTYGHTVGNYLLKSVAHRLKECLNHRLQWDTEADDRPRLARWHGDRFALLLPATVGKEAVCYYAETLLECLQQPFWIQGEDIYLTANMGIALAPYDGDAAEVLIQHAEAALYEAKRQGHSRYLVYASIAGIEDSLSQQRLANDLYRALTQQELLLYYQPQVDLATGNIIGLEALVRWQHPQLGLVPPDKFIPIAEEVGLIGQLDAWVLRRACLQYQQWRQAGLPLQRLAVNVSATQFSSAQVVGLVQEVLQDTAIAPEELELEITEETVTRNLQQAIGILGQLKDMGVKIALDDFGVGYSSLNLLKHFPVDTLKIDNSFLQNCPENDQDAAIVQTVITLGHNLNLVVLAEGVETLEQATWLQQLHCDLLQGYYCSRPQPPETLLPWLEEQMARAWRPKQGRQYQTPSLIQTCSGAGETLGQKRFSSLLNPKNLWRKHDQILQAVGVSLQPYLSKLPRSGLAQPGEDLPLPGAFPLPKAEPVSITSLTAVLQPNPQRRHLQREQLIRSVTEKIRQSLHLDDILSTIVEEVRHLIDTDRVILYKFSEKWDGHVVQESVSPDFPAILGHCIEDTCFSSEYVKYYRQGRVRAIEDVTTAGIADCHRDMLLGLGVRANLVLPVAYQDHLWGLLIAHHCRGTRLWRQDEVKLLGHLAVQSAIAIHQGELYQQLKLSNRALQKLSSQDRLTQLANRGRFDQKLREEWQRLARTQAPLALVMCDIDHFKQYNDTYGHPAGDRCLQQVAAVLQSAVQRPGDLVARYGGEEFVLLLPETDGDGASYITDQIQQALAVLAIPHGGSPLQQVTLSCGIACQVPQSSAPPSRLLQQADDALYQAKSAGRNQTILARPTEV